MECSIVGVVAGKGVFAIGFDTPLTMNGYCEFHFTLCTHIYSCSPIPLQIVASVCVKLTMRVIESPAFVYKENSFHI